MNEIKKLAYVVTELCPQNHRCPAIEVCPVRAISQTGHSAPVIDLETCIGCGKCAAFCPKKALNLKEQ